MEEEQELPVYANMSQFEFEPYIIQPFPGSKFLVGTLQSQRWYDPLPHPLRVELEWLRSNVYFGKPELFVDGGCHHGLYGVCLKPHTYYAVDLHQQNVDMTLVNAKLNDLISYTGRAAITGQSGIVRIRDYSLGVVDPFEGESTCLSVRLEDICRTATIVKLDIEGAEWHVFPDALDSMTSVHTWIVEIHPWMYEDSGGKDILGPFIDAGFHLLWIDRSLGEESKVEDLTHDSLIRKESTIIAIK